PRWARGCHGSSRPPLPGSDHIAQGHDVTSHVAASTAHYNARTILEMTDTPKARRIVVTGAARGIGAAIARRFLTESDDVLLVDRDDATLVDLLRSLTGTIGTASSYCADLADRLDIDAVVSHVRR